MTRFTAEWIVPISAAPIRGGTVAVEDGRIVGLGSRTEPGSVALGRAAVLPGLVNAHTHLELSFLRGQIPPTDDFLDWVQPMLAARRAWGAEEPPRAREAAREAIAEAQGAGTALVGDVCNSLLVVPLLEAAGLSAQVFYELIGFNPADAEGDVEGARRRVDAAMAPGGCVKAGLAAHAPYSVAPRLFAAIRRDLDAHPRSVSSVHVGESPAEVEFLRSGGGAWRSLLTSLGVWDESWRAPGTSPVGYLEGLGFLDRSVLAVHGVQCDGGDLERLRALGVTVVACPRSNRHVGVGSPPLEAFYAVGVQVAFGTDSLASVEDLNLFAELAEARRIAPLVPARALLESATLTGARALGYGGEYGSLEPGKRAALIAVSVPDAVDDVEEYLLSGIQPDAVRWIDTGPSPA